MRTFQSDSCTILVEFSRRRHPSMSLGTDHTPSTLCHTCTLASCSLSAYIGPRSILCLLKNNPAPSYETVVTCRGEAANGPTSHYTDGFGSGFWHQGPHVSDLARLVQLLALFAFMSQTTNFPAGIRPLTFPPSAKIGVSSPREASTVSYIRHRAPLSHPPVSPYLFSTSPVSSLLSITHP